jgi:hypothetical protein
VNQCRVQSAKVTTLAHPSVAIDVCRRHSTCIRRLTGPTHDRIAEKLASDPAWKEGPPP